MNTTIRSILLLVALVAGNAQSSFSGQDRDRKEVSTDSYAVYSAILTQHYGSWFRQKEPILVLPYTVLEPQGHQGCRTQAQQSAVVQDLLRMLLAEKEQFRIAAKFRLPGPYKVLTGKAEIRENHEPGAVFLSAVGFSRDSSKAIVLVGHNCGGLCGDGYVWILDKRKGNWHMTHDQLNCGWVK